MANKHCVAAIVFEKGIARVTYNYDFESKAREDGESDETYKSVSYNGLPSSNGIKKAVVESEFPLAVEQKLVNEYNAGMMGVLSPEECDKAAKRYRDFLYRRKVLFEQIERDCIEAKIK